MIRWHFELFGPYVGSGLIGVAEIVAALLFIAGYWKSKAGIIGGLIASVMFFITSTMLITTPGTIVSVPGIRGMRYMSFLGLFLFKDVISLGVSFYLISYFGNKAILSEKQQLITKADETWGYHLSPESPAACCVIRNAENSIYGFSSAAGSLRSAHSW